jgi:enoyl-CoA hydratase
MTAPTLTIDRDDGVATVTLNRPETMNALSLALREALVEAFETLAKDEAVRVVILTGAGRAFCAGLDLKELSDASGAGRRFGGHQNPIAAMAAFPGPIIGAINGHAITGGFELALACDLLVGSTRAVFADTHIRVGVMPGWGLSQKLSRLIGIARAKEISLSGNFVDAARAEAIGLVNRIVAPEDLMDECRKLARDMAACDPVMLYGYKRLIDDGYAIGFRDALALEGGAGIGRLQDIDPAQLAERRQQVTERGRSFARKDPS